MLTYFSFHDWFHTDFCFLSCPTACTIGKEFSYSVEVSVTLGASLDIGEIFGAGVSGQVSKSTAHGTALLGQTECTGPWTCSVTVTPKMREVKGFSKTATDCTASDFGPESPYTVRFPVIDADSKEKFAVANIAPCACTNKAASGDPGAPPPCPEDC